MGNNFMKQLTPYLIFNGNCKEALSFYEKCLGGKIVSIMTYEKAPVSFAPENNHLIFDSHFQADDFILRASDSPPENDTPIGRNFALFVSFSSSEELDTVFTKLVEGGSVIMPLAETSGVQFGMLVDKFGIQWMLNWHET
jgi:PhnB protein